jgi:putative two-component system response regulator
MQKVGPDVPRVLIVDDDPSVSFLLRHVLVVEGFQVDTAEDGPEALRKIQLSPPDVVLLDVGLPGMGGDQVCRQIKAGPATRLIPVVMITGGGAPDKAAAWDYGADEFLAKPFKMREVSARCRSLVRLKRLIEERDSAEAVLFSLARTVEAKSPYTHGHSERVSRLSQRLGRHVGLSQAELEVLRKGALLHDIGKLAIPDAILNKPGKLTTAEYELVKDHPMQGVRIIEPLQSLRDTLPLIRWHHERMDGTGYPDGKLGEELPLSVRVLSVCDVFDSLSSDRPYRAPIAVSACFDILREMAGNAELDGELVEEFCGLMAPQGRELLAGAS